VEVEGFNAIVRLSRGLAAGFERLRADPTAETFLTEFVFGHAAHQAKPAPIVPDRPCFNEDESPLSSLYRWTSKSAMIDHTAAPRRALGLILLS
jgi:hypothetical protein